MKKIIIILILTLNLTLNCAQMDSFVNSTPFLQKNSKYDFQHLFTLNHESPVNAVAWSNDNSILASGSEDGIIKIWNKNGKQLNEFDLIKENNPDFAVKALKWLSDSMLAVGCIDSIIILHLAQNQYLSASGEEKFMPGIIQILSGFKGFTYALAWSANNYILASSYAKNILLWNIKTGKIIAKIKTPAPIRSITWSDDSLMLGTIDVNNVMRIYNKETHEFFIITKLGDINKADYLISVKPVLEKDSNDKLIYKTITFYEYKHIIEKLSKNHSINLNAISYTSDEEFLASCSSDQTVKIWMKLDKLDNNDEKLKNRKSNCIIQ